MRTQKRKDAHLRVCAKKKVEFREKTTLLEEVELIHNSLPGICFERVSASTAFLGKRFSAPVLVNSITGGTDSGERFNKAVASVCQEKGIGMVLGSLRAMLEAPEAGRSFSVRDIAPDIFLAANIGALELKNHSLKELRKALKELKVDALSVHLNPAQEAMQPGNPDFSGCLKRIKETVRGLTVPVYVKEVGNGLSYAVCRKLNGTGIKAVDVSGAGGTSFVGVDSLVHGQTIGKTFWDWGIPTAVSIIYARKAFKGKIIASGGIRNGLEAAKAIALGADLVGIALPVVRGYYRKRETGVEEVLDRFEQELRTAMFLAGGRNLKTLKRAETVLSPKIRQWTGK